MLALSQSAITRTAVLLGPTHLVVAQVVGVVGPVHCEGLWPPLEDLGLKDSTNDEIVLIVQVAHVFPSAMYALFLVAMVRFGVRDAGGLLSDGCCSMSQVFCANFTAIKLLCEHCVAEIKHYLPLFERRSRPSSKA